MTLTVEGLVILLYLSPFPGRCGKSQQMSELAMWGVIVGMSLGENCGNRTHHARAH